MDPQLRREDHTAGVERGPCHHYPHPRVTAAGAARAMHAVPANPRTKRKGGGGRDDYDAVVAKIYKDPRMTRETREIALLLAWLVCRDPNRFNASAWKRAEAILGFRKYGRHTQSVAALLVADDLPRYDPEESGEAICSAPMIRRGGTCGQPAQDHSYTADPETGWRTPVWFCRRHATYGRELNLALADAPEPIPNRGGLLPCYFRLKSGLRGWEQNYKWAAHTADPWLRTEWLPPRYGVAAEGWPHPGRDEVAEVVKPKLQLVALDGELVDEQTPPTEGDQMT